MIQGWIEIILKGWCILQFIGLFEFSSLISNTSNAFKYVDWFVRNALSTIECILTEIYLWWQGGICGLTHTHTKRLKLQFTYNNYFCNVRCNTATTFRIDVVTHLGSMFLYLQSKEELFHYGMHIQLEN